MFCSVGFSVGFLLILSVRENQKSSPTKSRVPVANVTCVYVLYCTVCASFHLLPILFPHKKKLHCWNEDLLWWDEKGGNDEMQRKKSAGKLLESLPINFRTSLVITFCYLNQEVDLGGRRRWKINVYSTEVKWPSLPEELQELLVIPLLLIPESPLQWIFTFHLIPFSHLTYAKTAAPTRRLHLDVPYKSSFFFTFTDSLICNSGRCY